MGLRRRGFAQAGEEIVRHGAVAGSGSRHFATIFSATALALSLYSLWESSLRPADIHVYVPPVIQYAAPYQNSNFEMIAIPVTVANEGAQTGHPALDGAGHDRSPHERDQALLRC
jgi:hypothetical protein